MGCAASSTRKPASVNASVPVKKATAEERTQDSKGRRYRPSSRRCSISDKLVTGLSSVNMYILRFFRRPRLKTNSEEDHILVICTGTAQDEDKGELIKAGPAAGQGEAENKERSRSRKARARRLSYVDHTDDSQDSTPGQSSARQSGDLHEVHLHLILLVITCLPICKQRSGFFMHEIANSVSRKEI